MAPGVGLEPTTVRLTAECSTIELPRNFKAREDLNLQTTVLVLSCRSLSASLKQKMVVTVRIELTWSCSQGKCLASRLRHVFNLQVGFEPTATLYPGILALNHEGAIDLPTELLKIKKLSSLS